MIKQEHYNGEVEQCAKKPSLVNISDIDPLSPDARRAVECAYRRGFFQGYYSALDDSQSLGHAAKTHLFGPLYKWRYCKHDGAFKMPPRYRHNTAKGANDED